MPKAAAAAGMGAGKDLSKLPVPAFPPTPSAPASTEHQSKTKPPPKTKNKIKATDDTVADTPLPQSLYHLERAHHFLARGNMLTPEEIGAARALGPKPAAGKPKVRKTVPGPQQKLLLALHKFKNKNYTADEIAAGNGLAISDATGEFLAKTVEDEKVAAKQWVREGKELKLDVASRPDLAVKGVVEVVSTGRRGICRGLAQAEVVKAARTLEGEDNVDKGVVAGLIALAKELRGGR